MTRRILPHIICATLTCLATAKPVIEAVKKQDDLDVSYSKATDFSGITWKGGDDFYVVSNRTNGMLPVKLGIDRKTGAIESVKFGRMVELETDLSDFEGIAWQPGRERLYISCEGGDGIVGFDEEGDARFPVEVPRVFKNARPNKGLESMTFGAGHFWTANEDALVGDGDLSSRSEGGLVRIQKFNESLKPVAQFAYRTDTTLVRVKKNGTGVTDLCALPDGSLLVLERVIAAGLVAKIYLVDFKGATDVGTIAELNGAEFQPVQKKLLFERYTGTGNFEGIALGPELADGWRSLILIADSGGDSKHSLIPLRIKLEPTPRGGNAATPSGQ